MTETLVRVPHSPVLVWGYNSSGGLGLGHVARVYRPTQAALPAGVTAVQGGGEFTVARTSAGELYACGGNRYGQLGDGGTQARLTWEPVRLLAGTFVTDVQAGIDHVLALTAQGEVYAWGRNHRGQVGSGPPEHQLAPARVIESGAASLAAGRGTSAVVTTDGQLLTWGRNGSGQTGLGATSDVTTPTASLLTGQVKAAAVDVGYQHTVVLTTTGELLAFGTGSGGRPLPLRVPLDQAWGRVRAIRAGSSFTLALTSRGLLLAWGANEAGQLGLGDQVNRDAPAVIAFPRTAGPVTSFWGWRPLRRRRHLRRRDLHLGRNPLRGGRPGPRHRPPDPPPAGHPARRRPRPGHLRRSQPLHRHPRLRPGAGPARMSHSLSSAEKLMNRSGCRCDDPLSEVFGIGFSIVTGGTDHVIVTFGSAENGQ